MTRGAHQPDHNDDVGRLARDARLMNAGNVTAAPESAVHAVPEGLLDEGEIIVLLLRPSPWFVVLGSAGSVMLILIITLTMALLAVQTNWAFWTEPQSYVAGGALVVARLMLQTVEWMSHLYVLTDRRVIARAGVLRPTQFESPLSDIRHAIVFARLRERLLRLGSIGFATGKAGTFNGYWLTLRNPMDVRRIVNETIERYGRGPRKNVP